ncbi:MAG: VOC family protein [Proteobacteria bacterium]|nr:VOC family protein [Pseudomonadota bacterium]
MRVAALSYSLIEATDLAAWRRFGEDVAGFSAHPHSHGLALRIDERAGRLFIVPGSTDRYAGSGWEIASEAEFAAAKAELAGHGVEWHQGSRDEIALRHVFDMIWFRDPAGNRHELALGYVTGFEPFRSPAGVPHFVTGPLGFGHTVLPAPNIAECRKFMTEVLGFGLADILIHRPMGPGGPAMRIDFMHCANGRHHSLALFEGEVPSGCVHLMVEVPSLDEVGRAYDRMLASGARLMATLGKHTNDHMTSFYMMTPGGFALEYGFGGRTIDWGHHTLFESTSVSLWGHDFSVGFGADEKAARAAA